MNIPNGNKASDVLVVKTAGKLAALTPLTTISPEVITSAEYEIKGDGSGGKAQIETQIKKQITATNVSSQPGVANGVYYDGQIVEAAWGTDTLAFKLTVTTPLEEEAQGVITKAELIMPQDYYAGGASDSVTIGSGNTAFNIALTTNEVNAVSITLTQEGAGYINGRTCYCEINSDNVIYFSVTIQGQVTALSFDEEQTT